MGLSALFHGLTTAYSVGMGCGTCCGSSMGIFMSGYLVTHSKNMKQSATGFSVFYAGKILAVVILCLISSFIGQSIMTESGEILGINVNAVVDAIMIVTGLILIYKWFGNNLKREMNQSEETHTECRGSCSGCNSCGSQHKAVERSFEKAINYPAMLAMGICYGASPCAPLILMLGYCVTLPALYAVIIGLVFSVTSALSPTIIVILLSGGLAGKFRKEIQGLIKWFQLACYSVLIILSAWNLITIL